MVFLANLFTHTFTLETVKFTEAARSSAKMEAFGVGPPKNSKRKFHAHLLKQVSKLYAHKDAVTLLLEYHRFWENRSTHIFIESDLSLQR